MSGLTSTDGTVGRTATHRVGESPTAATFVAGGSTFLPIQAQQSSPLLELVMQALAKMGALQCVQVRAIMAAACAGFVAALNGQHTLEAHSAAHTPGAIALANKKIAISRRATVADAARVVTISILEHYRFTKAFPLSLSHETLGSSHMICPRPSGLV